MLISLYRWCYLCWSYFMKINFFGDFFTCKMLIFNSLAPGRLNWIFRWAIFKLMLVIVGWSISCEIDLRWISLDLTVIMEGNGLVPSGNPFWISIVFLEWLSQKLIALFYNKPWAQAEWIFNHIRDTLPANELQWVGMGLKQCRLLSIKTVSGTCSITHQWTPDIVSILILIWGILAFASLYTLSLHQIFIYIYIYIAA